MKMSHVAYVYILLVLLIIMNIGLALVSPGTTYDWMNYMAAGFILGIAVAMIIERH